MAERLTELTAADCARAEAVLTEHGRFIEAIAKRYAPSYDAVPDIVQEVGVRVCQSLHTFRAEANIKTWLFRITHNEAVTAYREECRQRIVQERVAAEPDSIIDIEARMIAKDTWAHRRRLLRNPLRPHSLLDDLLAWSEQPDHSTTPESEDAES